MALYYQKYGDMNAPLMVFLHGGGVSSWMWDKQVQYFTDYYCVTVDLPEQGRDNHRETFSIRYSAHKVIELIEDITNGQSITVIGFSLGAQVLIQMLSVKLDLIDYAIINSALVRPSTFTKMVIGPLITVMFPLVKNRAFSKLQAKTLYIDDEYFEKYYHETCLMERTTLVRILKENMSFTIPDDFGKATSKILVTVGEKEKGMMKKSAADVVKRNSNCSGVVIAEVGHGVSLAMPDFF